MEGMLKMDPKERFTALEALSHSYFDTIRDDEVKELIKAHKERQTKQREASQGKHEISRSKDMSRRKTSNEKQASRQSRKNPYSLPLGTSLSQLKKKRTSHKLYKDKRGSNSIKNKRNMGNNDALRENQSMSNYIPSNFNGLYMQNMKQTPDTKEYDYEIGGDFGSKSSLKQTKNLDNSMGLPSQIYGTDDLKHSISSTSGVLTKGKI